MSQPVKIFGTDNISGVVGRYTNMDGRIFYRIEGLHGHVSFWRDAAVAIAEAILYDVKSSGCAEPYRCMIKGVHMKEECRIAPEE